MLVFKVLSSVLSEVQKRFAKDGGFSKEAALQVLNPEIVQTILNPPTIRDRRGKEVIDSKWVDRLKAVQAGKGKGAKLVPTDRDLTAEERKAVRALNRELMIVKGFVKIIQGAKNAQTIGHDEEGNEVPVPADVDLVECLNQYKDVYQQTTSFFEQWQKRIERELKRIDGAKNDVVVDAESGITKEQAVKAFVQREQYALFLGYFVAAVRFVKNVLHYSQPFKSFVGDVKKDIVFKFNKGLRGKLEELVNQEAEPTEERLAELAAEHNKDWVSINSPKTYDPNDLAIYSKIGKFCGLDIKKEYRVAIGIAIVAFIQEQIAIIDAGNRRKKELTLYVRV